MQFTVKEVYCKSYTCVRRGRRSGTWRSNSRSWINENLGFSSQATQREGDPDCESPLGRGKPRDDLIDGRPHEAILSTIVPW